MLCDSQVLTYLITNSVLTCLQMSLKCTQMGFARIDVCECGKQQIVNVVH